MKSLGTLLLSCIAGCAELPASPVSPVPASFANYR